MGVWEAPSNKKIFFFLYISWHYCGHVFVHSKATASAFIIPIETSIRRCKPTNRVSFGITNGCKDVSMQMTVSPQNFHSSMQSLPSSKTSLSSTTFPQLTFTSEEATETPQNVTNSSSSSFDDEFQKLTIKELKERILHILPRMTGKREEHEEISALVNTIESKYRPVETLEFFNLAISGEWQLLFSTNRLGVPNSKLRLRELYQRIEPSGRTGNLTNVATWAYDSSKESSYSGTFDVFGTMAIKNRYKMNSQGAARAEMTLVDHAITLHKGSAAPAMEDVPHLVGMINRAIPGELFDPDQLGMDTTFLDENLRITRYTSASTIDYLLNDSAGNQADSEENPITEEQKQEQNEKMQRYKQRMLYEGVRNIFIRKDSLEINPK